MMADGNGQGWSKRARAACRIEVAGAASKVAVRMIEPPEQNIPIIQAHVPITARLDVKATASSDHLLEAVIPTC